MGLQHLRRTALGLACVITCGLLSPEEHAHAATGAAALDVGADIVATCTMVIATQLNFGTVDLSSPTPMGGNGVISVTCSNGAPIYITLGQGLYPAPGSTDTAPLRQMSAGGADRLDYNFYRDAAGTIAWGNTTLTGAVLSGSGSNQSATIYAFVPPSQSVMSGTYQDSVLATVTY